MSRSRRRLPATVRREGREGVPRRPADRGGRAAAPETLRRRLYRADASEDDLDRYRRTLPLGRLLTGSARLPGAGSTALVRTVPRRALVLVGAGVLVAALIVGSTPQRLARTTSPVSRSATGTVALTVAADVRTAFVRSLDQGRGAGLAAYFFHHPEVRPAEVTTLTRAATEEHDGLGVQVVRLAPSDLADHGGRITVMLTLARAGVARWRAVRTPPRPDLPSRAEEIAERRSEQLAGLPVSATVAYPAEAPDRLLVEAPAGVRWDAVVVFSN